MLPKCKKKNKSSDVLGTIVVLCPQIQNQGPLGLKKKDEQTNWTSQAHECMHDYNN